MRIGLRLCWVFLAVLSIGSARAQDALRIGMQDDPDALDPARSGTFAGRIVFAAVCDTADRHQPHAGFRATTSPLPWSWSADGLTLTLKLRDGVHFQGRYDHGCRGRARQPGALPNRTRQRAQGGAEARYRR